MCRPFSQGANTAAATEKRRQPRRVDSKEQQDCRRSGDEQHTFPIAWWAADEGWPDISSFFACAVPLSSSALPFMRSAAPEEDIFALCESYAEKSARL